MIGVALMAMQTPAPATAQAPPPRPCVSHPAYRAFDFWVGTWDVQRTGAPRDLES